MRDILKTADPDIIAGWTAAIVIAVVILFIVLAGRGCLMYSDCVDACSGVNANSETIKCIKTCSE